MKAKYFILGMLAGVVASAVVLAVAVAWLASRPVRQPAQAASSPAGDITVSIQEGYLAKMATKMAQEREPMIQGVAVDIQPGARVDMAVGLQVTMLGMAMDLQAQLVTTARVADGRLLFELQNIGIAGLDIPLDMLPQSMRTQLDTMLADVNDQANQMLVEAGLVPLSVTTDNLSISVSLRAR
jgi:hypothetical protein